MATSTLRTIRQAAQDRFYGAVSRPFLRRGTVDAGSDTNTLIDAAAAIPGATTNHWDNAWIKVATTTDSAAPEGEIRQVSVAGFTAATGTYELASAFSATLDAGDTYELHPWFSPDDIDQIINEYGRNLHLTYFFPLSCVLLGNDDNDMENSTANAFTGVAAAASKTTLAGHSFDTQVLKVDASSANGYVQVENSASSVNWDVVTNRTYYAAALARVAELASSAATGALVVWDRTNDIEIDRATVNQSDWMELIVPFSPASGVEVAQFRLMSTSATSGDETYWDDFQVYVSGPYTYPTPTWLTRKEQMVAVVAFPPGGGGPLSDFDYRSGEQRYRNLAWSFGERSLFYGQELTLHVDVPAGWRPYIIAKRPMPQMTSDTATVPLDTQAADGLLEGVLGRLKGRRAYSETGGKREQLLAESVVHKRAYDYAVETLEPQRQRINRTERVWVGR